MPAYPPPAVRRLGDQYPGPVGDRRVPGLGGHDLGEFPDHAQLLIPVQHASGGENLHPDVVAVARDVGQRISRQVMDEGSGVVLEQPDGGHLLPAHHRRSELLREIMLAGERARGGIDVDHRHDCVLPSGRQPGRGGRCRLRWLLMITTAPGAGHHVTRVVCRARPPRGARAGPANAAAPGQ